MRVRTTLATIAVALVYCLSNQAAWPCSVPVFRYALERWPPDPYSAVLLHRGGLTVEQQKWADELMSATNSWHVNMAPKAVDLDSNSEDRWTEVWKGAGEPSLPCLLLLYPLGAAVSEPAWSGTLTDQTVASLVDSPARKELVDRLVAGQSAVWVLLESGDPGKDERAAAFLEKRLEHLTKTLELPTLEAQDIESGLISIPEDQLKISFSVMRISRTNSAETVLVNMLMGTEDDLRELSGEPMAFPVFGRGRALYAIVGSGINEETVDEAAKFLTGACSCQVKEENPGVDLMLSGDWEHRVKGTAIRTRDLPPLVGLAGFEAEEEATDPAERPKAGTDRTASAPSPPLPPPPPAASVPKAAPVLAEHQSGVRLKRLVMLVAGVGLVAVAAFSFLVVRGRNTR